MFGWILMILPIGISVAGFCIPKKTLLRCLDKYSSKPVANIEYAHDAEGEQRGDDVVGQNGYGQRAIDGELELQANIKLGKMVMLSEG